MPNPQLSAVPASSAAMKRKSAPKEDEDDSASDSGSDVSMINVDFDFYNLNAEVDQIAIKRFLRQTLSFDDELVDVHPLADLILAESTRLSSGTSIKTDGTESYPWGLVSVIDIDQCRSEPGLSPFLQYLCSTLPSSTPTSLKSILNVPEGSNKKGTDARTGLIFSLRMLNLPLPLIPPLYKMLLDELPKEFEQFILWGRGYKLEGTEETTGLEVDAQTKTSKKSKKTGQASTNPLVAGSFPYHPEEEFIDKFATLVQTYPFKSAPSSRDSESFGVEQFGRLVFISRTGLAKAVKEMELAGGQ